MKNARKGVLAAVAGVVILAGCGSDDGDSASTPARTTEAAQPAAPGPTATLVADKGLSGAVYQWGVLPGATQVHAGKVKMKFHNLDQMQHELVVIRTPKKAAELGSGAQVPEDGAIGEIEDLKPDGSGELTVKLSPGHYALICNIPGHYKAGMHADLDVVS